jgi:uncharacterized protein YdaU (DUF1376 family)
MGLPYYKRYTGDYARDTRDLTLIEHGAYTLLLDYYYSNGCLKQCLEHCYRVCQAFSEDERAAVSSVLDKFFKFDPERGYIHERVEKEIAKQSMLYTSKVERAQTAAAARWSQKNASSNTSSNATSIEKSCQPKPKPKPDNNISSFFHEFWKAYPKKVAKGHAERAFKSAARVVAPEVIIAAVRSSIWPEDIQFVPYPSTWLNQKRWEDVNSSSSVIQVDKKELTREEMIERARKFAKLEEEQ